MLVTESGMTIFSRLVQPLNAAKFIAVTESGISTFFNETQPSKASSLIDVTVLGILMLTSPEQLWKRFAATTTMPFSNVTFVKALHPLNGPDALALCTVFGITILVRPVQSPNAFEPKLVRVEESVTSDNFLQA